MYYLDKNNIPWFEPLQKDIEKFGLTECTETEFVSAQDAANQLTVIAKVIRDQSLQSSLEYFSVSWQVTDDANDIRNAISDATFIGADDTDSQAWRLADNTFRTTTLAELKEVLAAYIARKKLIWQQFAEWCEGDMSEAFSVDLSSLEE